MDAIYSRQSVYLDGRWMDAQWLVETLDGETGEMVITATVIGEGAPIVTALRMDMGLAARLREAAGFEGARPGVEEQIAEIWRAVNVWAPRLVQVEIMANTVMETVEEWSDRAEPRLVQVEVMAESVESRLDIMWNALRERGVPLEVHDDTTKW